MALSVGVRQQFTSQRKPFTGVLFYKLHRDDALIIGGPKLKVANTVRSGKIH